uniref:Uncharacterized protein n=1 Tax=Anguilla anguilla TaxID=7936 RepID=A0A0E9R7J6_ANGAN
MKHSATGKHRAPPRVCDLFSFKLSQWTIPPRSRFYVCLK